MAENEIPFGFVEAGELCRSGLKDGEKIILSKVTEADEKELVEHYQERFKKLRGDFTRLENRILGTENKGSFLAKIQNMKSLLLTHDGLGDYAIMFQKLSVYEEQIIDVIKNNRKRNTDIKNALTLELEEALKNIDMYEVGVAIKDIRLRWIKTGNADDEVHEELEKNFEEKCQSYYDKRKAFYEDKKMLVKARVGKYDAVLTDLEKILKTKDLFKSVDAVKKLQADWKSIGHIPEEEYKSRNSKYWELTRLFFAELKSDKKLSGNKQDFKGNLKLKKAVLDHLNELKDKSLHEQVSNAVDESKSVWKSIGPVPKEELDAMNKSFIGLLDDISERAFVHQLSCRKFKGFVKKSAEERNKLLIKTVKDLLSRDQNDLKTFRENMDNMHVNKGSFVDMLEKKLKNQEKRVASKKGILNDLQSIKKESVKQ
ncbi:MAG: DUF349 domain-containing protein [Cyclobacteriaceae bacterium]